MAVQKLSSKNQIVIPKEARQAMGVKGGGELLIVVKDDLTLVMPKPKQEITKTHRGRSSSVHADSSGIKPRTLTGEGALPTTITHRISVPPFSNPLA